jgi:hypothetical protein
MHADIHTHTHTHTHTHKCIPTYMQTYITYIHTGNCDSSFLDLARACGWEEDLKQYKGLMAPQSQALFNSSVD